MSYDAHFYLPDADETYSGRIYLPGEPVSVSEWSTGCSACGYLVTETEDVTTGQMVARDATIGDHDGIVGWDYAPAPGGGIERDAELWHLRCVLDNIDMGSQVLTVGTPTGTGKHSDDLAGEYSLSVADIQRAQARGWQS